MRSLIRSLPLMLTLSASGCAVERAPVTAARAPESPPPTQVAAAVTLVPAAGERAPVVVEGDVVHVNNRLCGVSRSPMGEATLGQFVSRVQYTGSDPRYRGRTFTFNQCCGGCLQKFPELWAERADEILAFHGVELAAVK